MRVQATRRRRAASPASAPRSPTCYLQIRVSGDLALFQAIGAAARREDAGRRRLTATFIDALHRRLRGVRPRPGTALDWDDVLRADRAAPRSRSRQLRRRCSRLASASSSAGRWASPSTATRSRRSRRSSTSLLLRGNIGRPGAGAVPGARPLQRAGRPHDGHLRAARRRVPRRAAATSSASSRRASTGYDTVDAIRAMRDGKVEGVLRAGRQLRRRHARHRGHRARRCARCALTVQVSTKLNRSHVRHRARGADPAVPRPHRAGPPGRRASSSSPSRTRCAMVHASRGPLAPALAAPAHPRSRSSAGLGRAAARHRPSVPWTAFGRRLHA